MQNIKNNYPFLKIDQAIADRSTYDKVTICCQNIEYMFHFSGIVATALYRECPQKNVAIDHSIFMSFEKGFFGSWLYLSRKIGEFFYDETYQSAFGPWIDFLKKYGYDENFVHLCSELLNFRNDVRHGSASQNVRFVTETIKKWETLHAQFGVLAENNPIEAEEKQIFLCENEHKLKLSPFISKNTTFSLHNVGKDKKTFYSDFGLDYESYLQEKEKKHLFCTPRQHFSTDTFDKIQAAIDNGKRKIILWAPPGGGKTYTLAHFSSQNLCYYNVADSPLRIKTSLALQNIYHHFHSRWLPKEKKQISKSIDINIELLSHLFCQFPNNNFVIAVDNLFSVFVERWRKDSWLSVLSKNFPNNVTWMISACPGEPVSPFFDISIDISPVENRENLEAQGNPKLLELSKHPGKITRYFDKWLRAFEPTNLHKRILVFVAKQSQPVTVKEIATSLQIFTPKVERFLHEIDILMSIESSKHLIYHPWLAQYIGEKYE